MSFRFRLTVAAASAVAVAVALASGIIYVVVRGELRGQFDQSLRTTAQSIDLHGNAADCNLSIRQGFGGPQVAVQFVQANGVPCPAQDIPGGVKMPVSGHDRAVAAGRADPYFRDIQIDGKHARVLTGPVTSAFGVVGALQVARSLDEVDHALRRIRFFLILIALSGVAVAAALGLLVARTALAPVRRLTATAEHVSETRDLRSRIESGGRDELGRLAASFNRMLEALDDAAHAQRQLVADASHELRTPLTSLRTNIEVLARDQEMPADERERLLSDVVEQLVEMSALVAALVELAQVDRVPHAPQEVRLDLLVADAVARAQRNAPQVGFAIHRDESTVQGVPDALERAVGNLLDNAAKWSPDGGVVEVRVSGGVVTVRDHGPGIADEDLPHVFDRFYRARAARGRPGSGLGLAIVRRVAEAHGGEVTAARAEGGGTLMTLRLPPAPAAARPLGDPVGAA